MIFWAIIGAAVGALWALFHYGSEGWLRPLLALTVSFGIIGAILSLLVGKGCKT